MCMSVCLIAHTRTYLKQSMKKLFSVLFLSVAISIPVMADDVYFEETFE